MISKRMAELLIEQVGHELRAHQLYMGMSIWFERQSLSRWAKLFRDQSVEEARHADKVMHFLIDNDVAFELPALKAATTRYGSAQAVAQAALESEQKVSGQFREMDKSALAECDLTAHQFLQWFIEEQVDEVRKAQGLLGLVESGINLFQAEPLLDQFE